MGRCKDFAIRGAIVPPVLRLAIRIGNRMDAADKKLADQLDRRPASVRQARTSRRDWTIWTGLRSRGRRFESCRGRSAFHLAAFVTGASKGTSASCPAEW